MQSTAFMSGEIAEDFHSLTSDAISSGAMDQCWDKIKPPQLTLRVKFDGKIPSITPLSTRAFLDTSF